MSGLTFAAVFVSCLQVGGGGAPDHASPLGCLGLLLALVLLPVLSYCILRARSFLNRSGKEKPDFTSLRGTGKTIVNDPPDDDDPNQFGSVN